MAGVEQSTDAPAGRGFWPSETFDLPAMCAFMRRPDLYASTYDSMAPAPEQLDLEGHLLKAEVWTLAAMWQSHIVGYVQFNRRTSVAAEVTTGFHPQVPGVAKKAFGAYALAKGWRELGLLTVWALIPSDHRKARLAARVYGFEVEGRLRQAIVHDGAVRDVLVYALHRPEV